MARPSWGEISMKNIRKDDENGIIDSNQAFLKNKKTEKIATYIEFHWKTPTRKIDIDGSWFSAQLINNSGVYDL